MKTKCTKCEGSLVAIGSNRRNGKGFDWEERKLHKKCWKEIKENIAFLTEHGHRDEAEKLRKQYNLL